MTVRINNSNKRKLVADAVSKLLDENRQKHITIEGEERDFLGASDSSDQLYSLRLPDCQVLNRNERNHIERITERSRE